MRFAANHIPVEVSGEQTDKVEVSHRDLERVETNNIRGGALLAMVEGVIQKSKKSKKISNKLGLDWDWLEEYSKPKKDDSKEDAGDSDGSVSLEDIMNNKDVSGVSKLSFDDIINVMIRGGWPETLNIPDDNKYEVAKDYIRALLNEEIKTFDGVERNPQRMNALLKSISRNISTSVSKSTILDVVKLEFENELSRPTLDDYLNVLERLYILESIPATNLNLRSKTPLRTTPKLELVDPSLAIAALDLKKQDLVNDLNLTGFLFENMCIRDLKIYADAMNASLSYFRDKNDFEVDVILRNANGKWGAIEIKLGAGYINEAANNLLKFKERVDIEKCGEPSFLMVLTGADYSYKRDDGVYVISIGNLKN